MEPFSVGVPLKLRDSQKSNVGDWELEENLTKLHELFQSKVDTLKLCTEKVVNICSESLTASNIRHSPITHRIKKWDSAKGSIRRRHQERIVRARLRDAVGDRNRKWLDYCYESGLEPQEDEMEPFQNPAQMLSALHDFGGVRISLYFPGDVERVTAILGEKFKITRKSDKTQGSGGNVRSLQERINHLQDSKPGSSEVNGNTAISAQGHSQFARTFTGYKATHFVIEHDMIYKPQELQGEKISDDEERVLDLINGIVLTGEAALRQLEASTAKRLYQRAENKEAMASSYYELAAWIEKHCEVKGMPLSDEGLLRVAMDLPKANRVVGTAEYDGYRRILVPGMISRLFPIENPDHVTGGNDEMPGMHVDDTESYRILDVIDSYLTHKGVKVDDGYIIWDLLMTPHINLDHNMELDIVKLDLYKEIRGVKTLFEKKQNVFKGHSNGILELAYSLYPESRWEIWVKVLQIDVVGVLW
ncbi:hypothetical protein UCREL1_10253 [Eutypa lata UCREL1]|uniref:Uncharacterized protein n=1 Tax=Eutypa lata (strain UCR-EL1) TaxID=1287681 RepID=M7S9G6_EUTLA|nr:hypothetical protein UCREL1_10253 [Eutypa lata UCREL1]